MGLFDLFRKSEWRKLQSFPSGVQHDIAYLVALDSLVKAAVANAMQNLFVRQGESNHVSAVFERACREPLFAREVHLAVLSTGIGKEFSQIPWAFLPSFRAVGVLGIMAMCEFRNAEELTVQNDIKHSGYSADPDEARTQILVMQANEAGVDDFSEVRSFDQRVFRDFWVELRQVVFSDLQRNARSEPPGLSAVNKERFDKLSDTRKKFLLMLAESLANKKPQNTKAQDSPSVTPKPVPAPFNLEQNQREHPFKYVPYTKLIKVMDSLSAGIARFYRQMRIDEYELRRLIGAKKGLSEPLLADIIALDADTTAYCIVVVSVLQREPDFTGCGVWKKLTETLEKRNMMRVSLAVAAMTSGMVGSGASGGDSDVKNNASLALNLINKIRGAARKYISSGGDELSRVGVLLGGTVIFKHVINHPRYGSDLGTFVSDSFASLDPILDGIKGGELLTWKEQEQLKV